MVIGMTKLGGGGGGGAHIHVVYPKLKLSHF